MNVTQKQFEMFTKLYNALGTASDEHDCATCGVTYYEINMEPITNQAGTTVWLCDECYEKEKP